MEKKIVEQGLHSTVGETIKQEKQQLQISELISEDVIDSQIVKIIKEARNEETVHQAACSSFSAQLQDEVMTQLLDEIIDEEQNNFNMNRT